MTIKKMDGVWENAATLAEDIANEHNAHDLIDRMKATLMEMRQSGDLYSQDWIDFEDATVMNIVRFYTQEGFEKYQAMDKLMENTDNLVYGETMENVSIEMPNEDTFGLHVPASVEPDMGE